MNNNRAYALDALRGYAIITMVLSGAIVWGILPGWMYHAQLPPPTNIYNPDVPGITWVDLVFPFFLFAMGAAFPFSIGKRMDSGESKWMLIASFLKRGLQLTFFAIFIQHFYPWVLSNPQDMRAWGLSILCFALLFPLFMKLPIKGIPQWGHWVLKILTYTVAVLLMKFTTYADGRVFTPEFSNIIILVLANMAFWGSLIYLLTRQNRLLRIAVLPLIMAVFLGSKIEGSWTQMVFNYSPCSWIYQFLFLKYLFIVIPGSIAGECLVQWMKERKEENVFVANQKRLSNILLFLSVGIIVLNLYCLYSRYLVLNIVATTALLSLGCYLLRNTIESYPQLWKKLFYYGSYLLVLGLCFESYEGGIKKDPSTYSYYFVTSGLAFMALLAFNIICDYKKNIRSTKFLVMSGQNPMIAYVTTSLFTMPLLGLLGITPLLSYFSTNVFLGFLQGVLITTVAVLVTMFFTRIKWFWRT